MFMDKKQVDYLKRKYVGKTICLISMPADPWPIEPGTLGTCTGVDDAGQLLMHWENGRGLSLIPGTDIFETVE